MLCTAVNHLLEKSVACKSLRETFEEYYSDLVQTLPMMDTIFIASVNNFFCGDQKKAMEARNTSADRASYFLDNIIESSLEMYFEKLLDAMEVYEGPAGKLAIKIKRTILIGKIDVCQVNESLYMYTVSTLEHLYILYFTDYKN